jgi:hypothetical protein
MGLAVAHVTRNGLHTGAASRPSSSTQPQRSLLLSAAIVGLVLLLMPCMNTTTAATRFLSPLHATLFLALHRPAFSVFLVVILLQYQNELWQQSTEAAWSFPFFVCPIYYFIILSVYHFIILASRAFLRPKLCCFMQRLSESSYAFMLLHPVRPRALILCAPHGTH